jgi:hypothetical protein
MIDREFDLSAKKLAEKKVHADDDLWVVEIAYEETAEYYPGIEFSPQQRIGLAAELFDAKENPTSPQEFLQKLPVTATMVNLGVPRTRISNPVVIKLKR